MEPQKKIRAHYVLSTHWDREWYQSFQNYRYQLVRLIDRIFEGIDNGILRGPFQTDGQAIILEDYLEVRPDKREKIRQLAQEGKLVIGPWYCLPDEFLVAGESIVRNIQLGRQIARDFGTSPSQAGFACDLFGHISQLPQIFDGFGIKGALIWRGINHVDSRHIRWQAADGTELLAYRFPTNGYCDYTFKIRHALEHERPVIADKVAQDSADYLREEAEASEVESILLFDGGDHEEWDPEVYVAMFKYADESEDEFDIIHTSLDAYIEDTTPQIDRVATVVQGELREVGTLPYDTQWLIPGVLSSRVWIKQRNQYCESMLCNWAEPVSTWAHRALGKEYPQGFLNVAWKWLLKNHPHDSICGCSIDVVHEDMKFRFSQTEQITERLTFEAASSIAASIAGDVTDQEMRVVVFNPAPRDLEDTLELNLEIPKNWPAFNEFFGYESKPSFRIYGPDGEEIPYQRLRQTKTRIKTRIYETKFPEGYATDDILVSLPLHIPASGYTTLMVRAQYNEYAEQVPHSVSGQPVRHPANHGMAISERAMENENLVVSVNGNGSINIHDKRTGQTYENLLTFEDITDIGDGWYHGIAVNDESFSSIASSAAVSIIHDGANLTTFRIRTVMQVPQRFTFGDTMARTEDLVDLVIESKVSLRPGADDVEVETVVKNVAEDHRLRVLFPSGVNADTYLADSAFDVVERKIALSEDNYKYRELEVETRPQQSWTAVFEKGRGLAVACTGLMETAIRDNAERTLALTLLRSTRRTVRTNGEPEGLLLGDSTFHYRIVPLTGEPDRIKMFGKALRVAAGIQVVQQHDADIQLHRTETVMPAQHSFMHVDGNVVVTSAHMANGGLEVRLFNPMTETTSASVHLAGDLGFTSHHMIDLDGNSVTVEEKLMDDRATFEVAPKRIVTLRFE